MGKWLQLKKLGKHVAGIGAHFSNLWEWTLGYSMPRTRKDLDYSQTLQLAYTKATLVEANNS